MSACQAIEDACGVTVPEPLQRLRRLLYCGEWIESHALHVFLLHAPDFLGYDSAISMARDHRDIVELGLRLKKAGNAIMTVVGGRAVHPVNVRVGGFYRLPDRRTSWPGCGRRCSQPATTRWPRSSSSPVSTSRTWSRPASTCRCAPGGGYPIEAGTSSPAAGLSFPCRRVRAARHRGARGPVERAARPAARHRPVRGRAAGPLLAQLRGPVPAGQGGRRRGRARDRSAATRSARSWSARVELSYACDEALRIIAGWDGAAAPFVDVPARAGTGYGVTEAPRGMLYHRYELAR